MSSPRPMAPSSGTPATSAAKRTQRVHWMQRVHDRLDQRADIFVLDRALVLREAAAVDAVGHGLVLQVALAALVADRAVERMVDQQELHHAFARLLHHRRARGEDLRRLAVRPGTQVAHAHGAGGCGFGGPPFTSIRHMRQLPAIDRRSWKQKRGISAPAASHAWRSVIPSGTSISVPSTLILGMLCCSAARPASDLLCQHPDASLRLVDIAPAPCGDCRHAKQECPPDRRRSGPDLLNTVGRSRPGRASVAHRDQRLESAARCCRVSRLLDHLRFLRHRAIAER